MISMEIQINLMGLNVPRMYRLICIYDWQCSIHVEVVAHNNVMPCTAPGPMYDLRGRFCTYVSWHDRRLSTLARTSSVEVTMPSTSHGLIRKHTSIPHHPYTHTHTSTYTNPKGKCMQNTQHTMSYKTSFYSYTLLIFSVNCVWMWGCVGAP